MFGVGGVEASQKRLKPSPGAHIIYTCDVIVKPDDNITCLIRAAPSRALEETKHWRQRKGKSPTKSTPPSKRARVQKETVTPTSAGRGKRKNKKKTTRVTPKSAGAKKSTSVTPKSEGANKKPVGKFAGRNVARGLFNKKKVKSTRKSRKK